MTSPEGDKIRAAGDAAERKTLFRPTDIVGAAFLVAVTLVFVLDTEQIVALTKAHPYPMGFLKFAVLAAFGECLKNRISVGRWIPAKLAARAVVWGLFGIWISASFPLFDAGVNTLMSRDLWPGEPKPFWMSVWMNLLGGYAFFMMFVHYWSDTMLTEGLLWPWDLLGRPQTARWGKIVLITMVLFWIPAHTFTFYLPPHWRIVCAAYLGIALGLILSFAARSK